MSLPNLCKCEGLGCSANFIDRCDNCLLSLCKQCLLDHPCGVDGYRINPVFELDDEDENDSAPSSFSSLSSNSSSSSSVSQQVARQAAVPATKKRKVAPTVLVREPTRNFFSLDVIGPRPVSSQVSLVTSTSTATTSWVWSYFMKFDAAKHPTSKNEVSCNICKVAAETNKDIKFTIDYKVYHISRISP
jgi:hypothetical protein